jgi:hypothetical protein
MRNEVRQGGGKKLIHPKQALQRWDQLGSGAGFADKSVRAQQPDCCLGFGRGLLHSQEQDFGRRSDAAYLESGRYAIHHGHVDIEKHQLRVKRLYLIQRLFAIFRLAAYGEGVSVQELAHGMAHDLMIVDEQDSSRKSPLSFAYLQSQLWPSCYQRESSSIRG